MSPARSHLEYTLYIQLTGIEPAIWRRIVVPGQLTLHQLHQVLQVTMGWTHSHLHQFIVPGTNKRIYYGEPSPEDDYFHKDDRLVHLAQIAPKEGATFLYEYDFGDSWKHEITVEHIETTPKDEPPYPWCLDGQRACPPEDVPPGKLHPPPPITPTVYRTSVQPPQPTPYVRTILPQTHPPPHTTTHPYKPHSPPTSNIPSRR